MIPIFQISNRGSEEELMAETTLEPALPELLDRCLWGNDHQQGL